jgi:hypothetical protein
MLVKVPLIGLERTVISEYKLFPLHIFNGPDTIEPQLNSHSRESIFNDVALDTLMEKIDCVLGGIVSEFDRAIVTPQ